MTTATPTSIAPHSAIIDWAAAAWLPVSIQSSTNKTRSPGASDARCISNSVSLPR